MSVALNRFCLPKILFKQYENIFLHFLLKTTKFLRTFDLAQTALLLGNGQLRALRSFLHFPLYFTASLIGSEPVISFLFYKFTNIPRYASKGINLFIPFAITTMTWMPGQFHLNSIALNTCMTYGRFLLNIASLCLRSRNFYIKCACLRFGDGCIMHLFCDSVAFNVRVFALILYDCVVLNSAQL